jgi:hypothetical protein
MKRLFESTAFYIGAGWITYCLLNGQYAGATGWLSYIVACVYGNDVIEITYKRKQ